MASELKPCPFCGGADVNLYHSAKTFMSWVSCKSCGLEAPSETGITDAEAITYWNHRPAPADLKARDKKRYKLIRKSLQNKGLLPAATDTGLETVGWATDYGGRLGTACFDEKLLDDFKLMWSGNLCELVTRSQAEEILAAERAKADEYYGEAVVSYDRKLRIEALEAKLAAAQEVAQLVIQAEEDKTGDPNFYILMMQTAYDKARAVLGGKPS